MVFSDDDEKITDELDDLIDNIEQPQEDVSFYRKLDPLNIDHYPKFPNETRNLIDAIFEDDTPYYGKEDIQPDLYTPEDRRSIIFDKFVSFEKSVEKFKKTLENFEDSENQFFNAIVYSIMFYKSNGKITDKNKIFEVLGEDFYVMTCLKLRTASN